MGRISQLDVTINANTGDVGSIYILFLLLNNYSSCFGTSSDATIFISFPLVDVAFPLQPILNTNSPRGL